MPDLTPMTVDDVVELERLERELFATLGDEMQARYRFRQALRQIKHRELYRAYGNWDAYCGGVLKRNRTWIYQQVWWADVEASLLGAPNTEIRLSYRIAMVLDEVPEGKRAEVYAKALELAEGDELTPDAVRQAEELLDQEAAAAKKINAETSKRRNQRRRREALEAIEDAERYLKRWPKRRNALPAEVQRRVDVCMDVAAALRELQEAKAGLAG